MISFFPKWKLCSASRAVVRIMDSDVEMNHLERPQDEDNDDHDESDDEYDSHDDGAAHALLAQNTQTRGQTKQPATGAAATLWNQIGGIVVEVSVPASPFLLISDSETAGATDTLIHHHRPPIHW
jgi:hypothetical protein